MSLISLLIALAAERYLSAPVWQFNFYYKHYLGIFNRIPLLGKVGTSSLSNIAFIAIPVVACYLVLGLFEDGILYLIASTLVLIVCFGCIHTRNYFKQYLLAAFRGDTTACELHHLQLIQDKKLPDMGFGQSLVWLNYRYFIAIMIFFVLFGAPGALAYRLLTKITENNVISDDEKETMNVDSESTQDEDVAESVEDEFDDVNNISQQMLFWLDWLPVRAVAFCYMLVGHFSKAMPVWLEDFFDVDKQAYVLLTNVAQASEDFMIDTGDCTAEPCILVRLAKRTLLLCLAIIAVLILTGVLS
ncbi:beta-lactamase regulator AmpE [Thalassotalea piscium]